MFNVTFPINFLHRFSRNFIGFENNSQFYVQVEEFNQIFRGFLKAGNNDNKKRGKFRRRT